VVSEREPVTPNPPPFPPGQDLHRVQAHIAELPPSSNDTEAGVGVSGSGAALGPVPIGPAVGTDRTRADRSAPDLGLLAQQV
jgi:hypothetical protein